MAQLALRWILMHEGVSTVIPGAKTASRWSASGCPDPRCRRRHGAGCFATVGPPSPWRRGLLPGYEAEPHLAVRVVGVGVDQHDRLPDAQRRRPVEDGHAQGRGEKAGIT